MAARAHLPRSVIAAAAALLVAGCGGDKEPPPFKTVTQTKTATTGTETVTITSGQGTDALLRKLTARERRVLAPLADAQQLLDARAEALTAAAGDVQSLADRIGSGYNPPGGSDPAVGRLRDALGSFSDVLSNIASLATLLPQLSTELQQRSTQVAKRHPADAARLLEAKQRVDAAIADATTVNRKLQATAADVREQVSRVTVEEDALRQAAADANEGAGTSVAKISTAVEAGLSALAGAT